MSVSNSTEPIVRLENVSKSHVGVGVKTLAVNNVSLRIDRGEFVAIEGRSGSGKSTLLNVMGLIDALDTGACWVNGVPTHTASARDIGRLRASNFGYVFQSFHLVDRLSVEENVALSIKFRSISRSEQHRLVQDALERLGLSHRSKHYPSQLSGGQQQRVAIARAIVGSPNVIFADEPTGNLDSRTAGEVLSLLVDLNRTGTALVVVTHSDEVARRAKRRLQMQDGQLHPVN